MPTGAALGMRRGAVVDGLWICTAEPSRDPHPSPDNRTAVVSPLASPRGEKDE